MCWICFFYFNLCVLLLLFTKRILSIYNGLPRGTLPLCLNVKPKCRFSVEHPDPVHLWTATRKKKWTHLLPKAGHSRGHLQILRPFYFTSSSPPPLCAIKETGIQTPIRWLFWDFSLPSSWSASFPIKSYSLPLHPLSDLLACRRASRASVDCVTMIPMSLGHSPRPGWAPHHTVRSGLPQAQLTPHWFNHIDFKLAPY